MLKKWNELVAMSLDQSNALEEARDLLNFNQLVERVLQWIRVQVVFIQKALLRVILNFCTGSCKCADILPRILFSVLST